MPARVVKVEDEIFVRVSKSIEATVRADLRTTWKIRCPYCHEAGKRPRFPVYESRIVAERALSNHLKSHTITQGSFD